MRVAPNHQIIHLDRIFHDKPSSYWGSPILRTPHVLFSVALKSFSCGRTAGIETKFVPPGPPIGGTGRETTRVVNEKSLGETSLDLSSLCLRYVFAMSSHPGIWERIQFGTSGLLPKRGGKKRDTTKKCGRSLAS